jgi:hypothetical protein
MVVPLKVVNVKCSVLRSMNPTIAPIKMITTMIATTANNFLDFLGGGEPAPP